MATAQGQAQAALNQVNSNIATLTSQINTLQSRLDSSVQSKATRLSEADQNNTQDQIDALKTQRSNLQQEAARLAQTANPGAADTSIAERQAEQASLRQGWDQEVAASALATKSGPLENRIKTVFKETTATQQLTQSGGGTTVTRTAPPTPDQAAYYKGYSDAKAADQAAVDTQKDEYLRSKGLESATSAQKRAAIKEATDKGEFPPFVEPGTAFKQQNPNPPPGMPSTITQDVSNNTIRTDITVARETASTRTAADAAGINPASDGTGTNAGTAIGVEPMTAEEIQNNIAANSGRLTAESAGDLVEPVTTDSGQSFPLTSYNSTAESAKEPAMDNASKTAAEDAAKQEVGPSGPTTTKLVTITPNELHNYATYTYSLSLHLLSTDTYNLLADGKEWLPQAKTLIAGGGRYGTDATDKKTFFRASQFQDDFYFDGLSMETITGMNAQSKGTNAIDISFTLVEPYGFTLINRLLDISKEMDQPNYLTNPYVIQIDFFGNNDEGAPLNPLTDQQGRAMTKFIPCKIIEMKMKIGTAGSTYACRAVPYNHLAFSETVAGTPANFEITAKTVGDFFANDSDDPSIQQQISTKSQQRNTLNSSREAEARGDLTDAEIKKLKDVEASYSTALVTKSYTSAYNAYQKFLVDGKFCEYPVTIKFIIDKDIAAAEIVNPKKNTTVSAPMVNPQVSTELVSAINAQMKKANELVTAGFNQAFAKFSVNAGDAIVELINKVMRTSTYITNQLKDKAQQDKDGNPLKWFKIIPKLKLTKFDTKRNDWGAEITYQIIPYAYHNSKHPGMSISSQDEIRKNLRKKYSYIYSGQNNDIIDFSIDFDTMFYTPVNVLTTNSSRSTSSEESKNKSIDIKIDGVDSQIAKQRTGGALPNQTHATVGDLSAASGLNANNDPEVQRAADVMKSIYSNARGDMLNVKLKIIGDPEFIKTDDIYYNPANVAALIDPNETRAPDGSILTDRGDIFCLLSWRTPSDINQETGLPDFESFQDSVFDGVFKVLRVTNEFKSGKFEQTLDMIRFHDAISDPEIVGLTLRGQVNENKTDSTIIENPAAPIKEPDNQLISPAVRAAQAASNTEVDTDADVNAKYAAIAENGSVITAEQAIVNNNNSKDNTIPLSSEAQP